MPIVTYVSSSGNSREIDLPAGMSVMQGALNHRVDGILGECGGNCMCATCHVYVDASFLERLPPMTPGEKSMLSIAAEGPEFNSRLSCQIKMTDALEGITVRIPGKQK
jgi:ferredoxin, 2Fe-2S